MINYFAVKIRSEFYVGLESDEINNSKKNFYEPGRSSL